MKRVYLFIAFCLLSHTFWAQQNQLTPHLTSLKNVPEYSLPPLNNAQLLAEEEARRGYENAPRFAEVRAVEITPETHGIWESTDDGLLVWRLRINSPTAKNLNFGFTKYIMPNRGKLFIYTPDYQEIKGPFTPADNEEHEELWTPISQGDQVVIEVQIPAEEVANLQLKLSSINHGFQDFGALVMSGSCNLDVICDAADGWGIVDPHRDIIQSVAVISTGGGTFCTGFLINNVEQDCTPLFMTANHCGINAGNAPSLVTYWNFQNSFCRQPNSAASGNAGDGLLNDFNTGSIFRAASGTSDFAIVELDDEVSPTANAYFAGFDATAAAVSSAIGVHHPNTDEKRISFEDDALMFTNGFGNTPSNNYTHVRVVDWDTGTTEPGSSGSPIFDQDERVIGQLHGGGAACGNNSSDWYGALARSWEGDGTPATRVRDWLDPNNTGVQVVDGRYASACSFSVVGNPSFMEVCAPSSVTYSLTVSSNFTNTVSLSLQNLPAGLSGNFSPSAAAPGSNVTLTITGTGSATPGTYNFNVIGTDGANNSNDALTITINAFPTTPNNTSPNNGQTNSTVPTTLTWNGTTGVNYLVEISTTSNFSNIIETATVSGNSYTASMATTPLTTYYWRVRGSNDCGTSNYSSTWSFTTENIQCSAFASPNVPVAISDSGTPTITSTLNITDDLTISDLNVSSLQITHTWVADLQITLTSPTGTTVTLMDAICGSEDNVNVSFDDEANVAHADIPCPPIDGGNYQPDGNLGDFDGQSAQGNWTLTINDLENQDGGTLDNWDLQICYVPAVAPPNLIVNNTLQVPHNQSNTIDNAHLQTNDASSSTNQIVYIITSLPQNGTVFLNGSPLGIGAMFTQADIDSGLVTYMHNGNMNLSDSFTFDVTNSGGGSVTNNVFNIDIIVEILTANANATSDADCFGNQTGSLTASGAGGIAPYQYSIGGGFQNSGTFTGLGAGTYTVTVQDSQGTQTTANSVIIGEPDPVLPDAFAIDDEINIFAEGGTPGYTYSIDGVNFQASNTFFGVANGTYTATVLDANGCEGTAEVTVAFNSLVVSASVINDISCSGFDDGSLTVNVSGGTPNYQYSLNGGAFQNDNTFDNLAAGDYSVEVIDNEGFTQMTNTITISNPEAITANANVINDEITVTADGGTGNLTYSIDGNNFQNSPTFSGLANGTYTISIQDENACIETIEATVAVNNLSVSINTVNDISCSGFDDGSLTVNVSGGTPNYQYSLNGGAFQNDNTFDNLAAGDYSVEVIDNEGFTQMTNTITISNPEAITANANVINDEITVTADGGTGNLTYSIDGNNFQNSPTFSGLANGTYTISIQDENACIQTIEATVAVNNLSVSINTVNDISCSGFDDGSLTVNVSGGTPNYQYSLNGGAFQNDNTFDNLAAGDYSVEVIDNEGFTQMTNTITISNPEAITANANVINDEITVTADGGTGNLTYSIDGNNFQNSPTFSGLANGTYTISIQDENACIETIEATVAVNNLSVSINTVNDISCSGFDDGSLTVNVSGGTPNYQYSLNGGAFQNDNTFDNLAAGDYSVEVIDNEGFTQMANTITISNPEAITANANVINDEITVTADGGTGNLTYSIDGNNFQNSPTFSGLANGTYTISIQDENACIETIEATVAVNNLSVSINTVNDISCSGFDDGSLTVNVSGGTPNYQYSLNGGAFQNDNTFDNLAAGDYSVEVIDNEGFTQMTNTITISNPEAITANANVINDEITVTADGGTGNLTYSIDGNNFQNSPTFSGLANGTYTISIQDENACIETIEATVAVNNLSVSINTVNDISCSGFDDGSLTVNVSGGTPNYQYSLNGGAFQNDNTFDNLAAGDYSVEVIDNEGFTQMTNTITISNPEAISATAMVSADEITVSATGGLGDLLYSLDGIDYQISNVFSDLENGTYTIFVQDNNNCIITTTATIAENTMAFSVISILNISCFGENDGQVFVSISGGTAPFMYSLNGGTAQTENVFNNLTPGDYEVEVSDAEGFTLTTNTLTVNEPQVLGLQLFANGNTITAQASGGIIDYTFSINGGPYQGNNVFDNLDNGTYQISVRDDNGCVTTETITISENNLSAQASVIHHVLCHGGNNGQIIVSVFNATPPTQFSIDGGLTFQNNGNFQILTAGTYSILVVDGEGFETITNTVVIIEPPVFEANANVVGNIITVNASGSTPDYTYSIDGVNFQEENVFEDLENGEYTVTVMDINGCLTTTTVAVNQIDMTAQATLVQNISCNNTNDGQISVAATGGNEPLQYSIDGENYQANNTFNGLSAGAYTVTVLDANGNSVQTNTVIIINPDALQGATDINGNNVTVNMTGGTPNYQYNINGGAFQDSNEFNDLANGDYEITVIDANACTFVTFVEIFVNTLAVSGLLESPITCHNSNNGVISAGISGGVAPYQYSLNGINFQNSNVFSGLSAGTYIITVIDANGFSVEANPVVLTNPEMLSISSLAVDNTITVTAAGGVPGYEYSLNGGAYQTSNVFENLPEGEYTITVLDANGCSASTFEIVKETGLEDLTDAVNFALYPNPNTGVFTIALETELAGEWQVILFDVMGRTHYEGALPLGNPTQQTIHLPELAAGMYEVALQNKDMIIRHKLLIFR